MTLRRRLESVSETVQEFDLASRQKYREGTALVAAGYLGAGIYLLGYSAEMLLKNAYFRFMGASAVDRIQPRLAPALAAGRLYNPGVPHESYHSLRFWSLLLREARRRQRRPLLPLVDASFMARTRRLHQTAWIGMRYRPDQATIQEAQSAQSDVGWLHRHETELWR